MAVTLYQPEREQEFKLYPYLLKNVRIQCPNHVWNTDITCIKLGRGFGYLTEVMDWFSRYLLSWQLSNILENTFCVDVLEEALNISTPAIFNTDQGSQCTAANFLKPLEEEIFRSAWIQGAVSWIMFLQNACGEPSNTRRFT
ncbi:MAG: hypothetical protein CSB21_01895 [Deltaproteobacteria bacterium]|nr:MAG: hypothetical protein CSB21_01895 [Deltaproteobacteria bacterium]